MLSNDESKYYITILGTSKKMEKQIEEEIFQKNINKIKGSSNKRH